MANPAPIISQINAFNATEGTIISFNIVGGTSIVRSNIIYIYDLSDNSLICTHLYISTESIHELPANTDPSIAYASGKSSADFTNGKQYYAQIQTFTNTAGTEGASGASIAKLFWCLVDPTLTFNTIPSSISTTSYNVGAVYNSNTTATSNIVQQYQFNLYSATGVLVQSSGVITGSGAQQGTSTAYDLSYNFTGLNVGSSYYITVEVTTTQGMTVSAQSNTFTVSIDTPTLGEATVVNNACDGYISVTSNLSGEYGGSASGSIATFETASVNEISSLVANIDPIQDLHGYDKPWVGGAGKNKLDPKFTNRTNNGITFAPTGDGKFTITGTATASAYSASNMANYEATWIKLKAGTYTVSTHGLNENSRLYVGAYGISGEQKSISPTVWDDTEFSFTVDEDFGIWYWFNVAANATVNLAVEAQLELGSTATTFEPYSNLCPISGVDSVEASVVGKNLLGGIDFVNALSEVYSRVTIDTENEKFTYAPLLSEGYKQVIGITKGLTVWYPFKPNTQYTFICKVDMSSEYQTLDLAFSYTDGTNSGAWTKSMADSDGYIVRTSTAGKSLKSIYGGLYTTNSTAIYYNTIGVFEGVVTLDEYMAYIGTTHTATFDETVYGGTVDLVTGVLKIDRAYFQPTSVGAVRYSGGLYWTTTTLNPKAPANNVAKLISSHFHNANSNLAIGNCYVTAAGGLLVYVLADQSLTTAEAVNEWLLENKPQFCYLLAEPRTIQLDPQTITTLVGVNNVWANSGDVSVTYNIPITNLLVKRQDTADISGKWLTLYSQPITQASDMDFTFIDFLNQYGKTYKYALVPLLTQEQSGVEVEVEGGYTVSDEVVSIFDGVFVADNTAIYKLKAGVNYGDLSKVQEVGSINTIGSKYPIIVSNSKVDYRTASLSATIVADDYYDNGNLNRMDMVQKRELMESFFTNKRAKILKDWNGNIWLVVFIDNVNITFINEYGMGIATLTATWTEIGDVTNEEDLQNTRIINVG